MLVIWGSRGRVVDVSSGEFYCPQCEATRRYKRRRVAKYFTLYFIPLFQLENLGEYVECQACGRSWKPEVLNYAPPSSAERTVRAAESQLESGIPVHMLTTQLVAAGLDQARARQVVETALAGSQVTCQVCGFTYLGSIAVCANCGRSLHPAAAENQPGHADLLALPPAADTKPEETATLPVQPRESQSRAEPTPAALLLSTDAPIPGPESPAGDARPAGVPITVGIVFGLILLGICLILAALTQSGNGGLSLARANASETASPTSTRTLAPSPSIVAPTAAATLTLIPTLAPSIIPGIGPTRGTEEDVLDRMTPIPDKTLWFCNGDHVPVYSGPGTDYAVVKQIDISVDDWTIVAFGQIGDWYYIGHDTENVEEFVHESMVCEARPTPVGTGVTGGYMDGAWRVGDAEWLVDYYQLVDYGRQAKLPMAFHNAARAGGNVPVLLDFVVSIDRQELQPRRVQVGRLDPVAWAYSNEQDVTPGSQYTLSADEYIAVIIYFDVPAGAAQGASADEYMRARDVSVSWRPHRLWFKTHLGD